MLTDWIILGSFLMFFWQGCKKGLLTIVLGPLSLLLGIGASAIYYNQTKNFLISLILSIFAPIIIHIALKILLKLFHHPNEEKKFLTLGRVFGGIINLAWNGAWVVLTIVVLALLPAQIPWLNKIQDNILASKTYQLILSVSGKKIPAGMNDIKKVTNIMNDPQRMQELRDTKEMKDVLADQDIQALLDDDTAREQIKKKDFFALLKNPHMQAILNNPDLLKKFIALQEKAIR